MYERPIHPSEEPILRTLRRQDLADHRMSGVLGFIEGLMASQSPDHGIQALRALIEGCEELHEIPHIARIRSALNPANGQAPHIGHLNEAIRQALPPLRKIRHWHDQAPLADYDGNTRNHVSITFSKKRFLFTGIFVTREREEIELLTEQLGGYVHLAPSPITDYLVVGLRSHPAWKYGRRGRKIDRIEQLRQEKKTSCKIVSECSFIPALIQELKHHTQTPALSPALSST